MFAPEIVSSARSGSMRTRIEPRQTIAGMQERRAVMLHISFIAGFMPSHGCAMVARSLGSRKYPQRGPEGADDCSQVRSEAALFVSVKLPIPRLGHEATCLRVG